MINVIMHGCNGAMGKVVCNHIHNEREFDIVAGIDITLKSSATFPVFADIEHCDIPADVIIDFSVADAVDNVIDYAVDKNIPIVICTTGLSESSVKKLAGASKKIPVFSSANMSIGINLISALCAKAAKVLGEAGFDIEIVEKHHNLKKDAPSGTAYLLFNSINKETGEKYYPVHNRSERKEKRDAKEVGMHAVRGGTIIGEHNVIFAGDSEVVEITHKAASKEIFAKGAIQAAKFIVGRCAGMYDMADVIG